MTTSTTKTQIPQSSSKIPNLDRAACGMMTGTKRNTAGAVRITTAVAPNFSKASSSFAKQAGQTSAGLASPRSGLAAGQSTRSRAPVQHSTKDSALNRTVNAAGSAKYRTGFRVDHHDNSKHQHRAKHFGHTMPGTIKQSSSPAPVLEDQNLRSPISLPMITDHKPRVSSIPLETTSDPNLKANFQKPKPADISIESSKKAAKDAVIRSNNNSSVGGNSISAFGGTRESLSANASGAILQNVKKEKPHAHHHHDKHEGTLANLRKFSNAMGNFSMLEVITGLAATLATDFHSGWLAWTLDSVIETLHNSINSHKEIPWYVPKFLIKLVESISNKGVSFHHHTHDIEGHEHDEGCMKNYTKEMQEKLISFLTLVGSSLTFVFSLVKPSLFKKSLAEKVKESSTTVSSLVGKTKPFFETLLPLLNSGVMLSSGLVKSKLGNHADHAGAQNSSREDYYCGIGSLLLAIEPYLTKMNFPLGRISEMALGAVISALSIMNAIKGLGYNMTVKNVFNIIRSGDIKHLFKGAPQGGQKYPLNFFEKSSFANAGYGMMRKIMSWFKIELPAVDTLKTSQNTTKNA